MRALILATVLLALIPTYTWAQSHNDDIQRVVEVLQGKRSTSTLTPRQMQIYLAALTQGNSGDCPPIAEPKREAIEAAEELIHCLRENDNGEDCSRAFLNVRYAGDDVEDAVGEYAERCEGS